MRFANATPVPLLCGLLFLLCLPLAAAAAVTIEFTGTITSVTGDDSYFDVRDAGVGSALTGLITYEPYPDLVFDPDPLDCDRSYLFDDGLMTISVLHYEWVYNSLAISLGDCVADDQAEFMGQGAITYPISAPAHQISLKVFDQEFPYEMVNGLEVPTTTDQVDFDQATRLTGRIYSFNFGEIRFSVETVHMTGMVARERQSWDALKALFR